MADDPKAEQKREAAVTTAAALLVVYSAARVNITSRALNGVRSGLLLDFWTERVRVVFEKALKKIAADTARSASSNVSVDRMAGWLEAGAEARADGWTDALDATLAAIDAQADDFAEQVRAAVDEMVNNAPADAKDVAEAAVEFGTIEAEKANGKTTKTWHLGAGGSHRASHVAQNGLTIGIDERFPNGLRFPHSPGPPAETVNCNCFLTFGG